MIQRLLMLVGLGTLGLLMAGCMPSLFGSDQSAPTQQTGPIIPIINNGSDNSGLYMLLFFAIAGLIGALLWGSRQQRRAERAELTNEQILTALPDEVYHQIGGRRVLRTSGLDIEAPVRRAIGGRR